MSVSGLKVRRPTVGLALTTPQKLISSPSSRVVFRSAFVPVVLLPSESFQRVPHDIL